VAAELSGGLAQTAAAKGIEGGRTTRKRREDEEKKASERAEPKTDNQGAVTMRSDEERGGRCSEMKGGQQGTLGKRP